MLRRTISALALLLVCFLVASPADGGGTRADACGARDYAYAGVQGDVKAYGVAATIAPVANPKVDDGHVGGWIGLGGTHAGQGGKAQWIQVGLASFLSDRTSRMYYEVVVAGKAPRYVELDASVAPGEKHRFAVLEMAGRTSWWRVWVDDRAVSPPIHLPGSHGAWFPQAVAENWNGGTGACNAFSYRFSDVRRAGASGGGWRPLRSGYVFQDAGYRVIQASLDPRTFLARRA